MGLRPPRSHVPHWSLRRRQADPGSETRGSSTYPDRGSTPTLGRRGLSDPNEPKDQRGLIASRLT